MVTVITISTFTSNSTTIRIGDSTTIPRTNKVVGCGYVIVVVVVLVVGTVHSTRKEFSTQTKPNQTPLHRNIATMTASKTDYTTISSSSSSSDEQKMTNPWVKRTIFVVFGALAFYAGTIYSSNNKYNNNNNIAAANNLVRSRNGGGISNSDGGGITGEGTYCDYCHHGP